MFLFRIYTVPQFLFTNHVKIDCEWPLILAIATVGQAKYVYARNFEETRRKGSAETSALLARDASPCGRRLIVHLHYDVIHAKPDGSCSRPAETGPSVS